MYTIHISDIDEDFCLRKVFLCCQYNINWRKSPYYTVETLLTFRIGEKIEEITRECLKGKKGNPFKLKAGKFYLVATPDIIVEYNNEKYIIENKSINKISFLELKEPLQAHIFQLSFYIYIAKKYYQGFASKGYLVYIPKEYVSPPLKIFEVVSNEDFEKKVASFIKAFVKSAKNKVLPKRICQYPRKDCPVVNKCFR